MALIPIVLTPLPTPSGVSAMTFDQLLALICQYTQGNISTSVSFFIQGSSPPPSNQGLFFNQTDNRFEAWSNALGAYTPISELTVGQIKTTFIGGDELPNGFVLMDGRNINAIVGLTQQQKINLETLFGANNNIPLFSFVSSLSNLPAVGSFSDISNPAVAPTPGVIGNLPVSNPPLQGEVVGLRNDTESLDQSANAVQGALAQVIGISEQVLGSLNSAGGTTVYSKVFIGYPS